MDSKKPNEKQTILTTKHKLILNEDVILEEEKKEITTTSSGSSAIHKTLTHIRRIGDKMVKVVEGDDGKQMEETNMSSSDLDLFNTQWNENWKPSITQDVINKLREDFDKNENEE
jgi:aspartate aminotransferase-like enzyme